MNLFSLAAKLSLDSSEYTNGINKAEGMLSKVGEGARKIGTAMAGTLTAAAGAVAGLTKQAVEAYAQFEQLEGGVETLFKTSADKVKENAQKAFETAGMSANEYMELVTSFSASLIQSTGRGTQQNIDELQKSLDEEYKQTKRSLEDQYDARKAHWDERIKLAKGKHTKEVLAQQRDEELKELKRQQEDELEELKKHNKERIAEAEAANTASEQSEESLERAADLADLAIRDMSDNANKMGTDISSIQNAYSGFAKQNYTMLDNLKLGYGGTKEEMERLLKDAEKLTGKKYNLSSYADIVEAIHAIQTEMKISGLSAEEAAEMVEQGLLTEEEAYEKMGTTAKEAQTTIEGSSKAMKAAWQNMLVAFVKGDAKKATKNLVRTVKTYLKNITPVITQAISGIGDFLTEIAPMIGEELPKLIADIAPKLFDAGKKLVSGLVKGIFKAIKSIKLPTWNDIKQAAINAWNTIVNAVSDLGGLIFGRNNKGEVNWPTWDDITAAASALWEKIKGYAADLAGLIFGKKEDGSVNFPVWDDGQGGGVKGAITTAWKKICEEAEKLVGFKFGDITSVEDALGKISEKWTELKTTIADNVVNFAKSFFGENVDSESIANAVKIVCDALVALGAGFLTLTMVNNFTKVVNSIKTLFSFDPKSKTAMILAGIATAIALIIENWKDIEPVLKKIGDFIDTYVITPIREAINDIKRFLGMGIEGELKKEDIENVLNAKNANGGYGYEAFTALDQKMRERGFTREQVDAALDAYWEHKDDPEWIKKFLEDLGNSRTATERLKEEVDKLKEKADDAAGNRTITYDVVVNDPNGILTQYGTNAYQYIQKHSDGSNAKGNWDVPYDNFLANLHRGEMVLTSSQARRYREGDSGANIDLSGLHRSIVSAVREGLANAQVNAYMDGKRVTKESNRVNSNELLAGRFRP